MAWEENYPADQPNFHREEDLFLDKPVDGKLWKLMANIFACQAVYKWIL